jgi:hypothetical protein
MRKKSAEDLSGAQQGAILPIGGRPEMGDRPVVPGQGMAPEQQEIPDSRKITVVDKNRGDELKLTIESNKEQDPRMQFLMDAFGTAMGQAEQADSEQAAQQVPQQTAPMPGMMPPVGQM